MKALPLMQLKSFRLMSTSPRYSGLAGLGAEKTNVQIVADPTIDVNRHEIIAKGSFGEMNITVHNRTSPRNAKTSFLAVLSAIECLRSVCNDSIHIGT